MTRMFKIVGTAVAALVMSLLMTPPLSAQDDGQILNFRQADVRALIDDVALVTGRTFIIDPRVRGDVSLVSHEPVPNEAVFDLFLATLRVHGWTAVPTSRGAFKIVPEEAGMVDFTAPAPGGPADQLVTEVFRLNHVDPLTALNTIKPILHRQARANAFRNNNFLLVVDYASNMVRIAQVLSDIDRDPRITRMITLENTGVQEMADTISALRRQAGGEDGRDVSLIVVPVVSSNTLILKGSSELVDEILPVITDLDARNANKGDIRVIRLKHADAELIKPMLDEVSKSIGEALAPGGETASANSAARASISFHKATNALVISAAPSMQKALEEVVREIDVPRAQIQIEAIIVEMSDAAAQELGVQYILSGSEGADVPFTATNYSNTAPNLLAATGALLLPDRLGDDNAATGSLQQAAVDSLLGLNGFSAGFAGQSGGVLFGVIVNALENDTASNILSTPSIMTLDNSPGEINVGQDVPIVVGQALGNNNANPFTSTERTQIGIKLKVTPHVSDNGEILMEIEQEVSSIAAAAGTVASDVVFNTRNINTSVRVGDGELLVLGGLIQSDERISIDKVPLLGDIPLLGNLFKSESKSRSKTNLMVFIRPKIVTDSEVARDITARKFQVVRNDQRRRWTDEGATRTDVDVILEEIVGAAPIADVDIDDGLSNREDGGSDR